jgi:methylphosphotriester-DNA--protein-cysteine methyltransferase
MTELIRHSDVSAGLLRAQIKKGIICFGGHAKLKIFGKLSCSSGKRMKKNNRVFFKSAREALQLGFRPCGHCMKTEYKKWKDEFVQQ